MGNFSSTDRNELLKRSNVKLQAQHVPSFDGKSLKWHSWNKKTKAAVGTAGMLKVLEDKKYATSHTIDNETVFHLLQVATADGNAAHLVDMYESEKDGYEAYQELVKWYEGDELTSETAEDVRSKIDKLSLNTKNSASQYINQFLQHKKHLEELNEEYTASKTVSIFLTQITDPDYEMTVEHCIENKLNINDCIERIRAKERRLDRERGLKRKVAVSIRRQDRKNNRDKSDTIKLEDFKTEKGFYSIPSDVWFDLTNEDKSFVKSFNGKKRREREDNDLEEGRDNKRKFRRTTQTTNKDDKSDDQKSGSLKEVRFREADANNKDNGKEDDGGSSEEQGRIIQRRGALRFKIKED